MSACGGESSGPTSNNPGTNNGTANISARIDGTAWSDANAPSSSAVVPAGPGLYSLVAVGLSGTATYTLAMSMYNIKGVGTYPIGVGPQIAGASATLSVATGAGWSTPLTGADGTLTLTEVTPTRMSGSFTITLSPLTGGATGTRTVTEGQFVLPMRPASTFAAPPDNAGHRVSATLGGAPFNAAAAGGTYNATNGTLTVVGNNNTRSVSLTLAGITGTGTYALSNGTPARTIGMSITSPAVQSYSSAIAGSSGTVVITSITATRIAGTYSATLGAALGASGTLTVTNGVFDIGR